MGSRLDNDFFILGVEPQLVLGMRKYGPYKSIGIMIPELFQFATKNNIKTDEPPLFICHETSTKDAIEADNEGNADVEVTVPMLKRGKATKEVTCYMLLGAKMVKTIHKIPYQEETITYQKLFNWLKKTI
jgi:effector-binding domain-containing protein